MGAQRHYLDVLERLKGFFPAPTSNPVMDGYFVHTLSQFLDRVDRLKGKAPLLDHGDYEAFTDNAPATFPEEMSSVEQLTDWLTDYCQGMMIWAHPNCQSQVVPPPTISSIAAVLASALYNPNLIQIASRIRCPISISTATTILAPLHLNVPGPEAAPCQRWPIYVSWANRVTG